MAKTTKECLPELEDSLDAIISKCHKIVELIRASKRVVAFTGAGVSTSAGIPDYRGPTGKWTREAKGLAPVAGVSIVAAAPTYTHRALKALMANGVMTDLISQNTDGLHARSGVPLKHLWELHGNSWKSWCWSCDFEQLHHGPVRTIGKPKSCAECLKRCPHFCHCTADKCPKCGAVMKSSIINFGENLVPRILEGAQKATDKADVCLALGSSLTVTPAADIPASIVDHGGHLVIVNLQATPLDAVASVRIFGKTDQVMRLIMEELGVPVDVEPSAVPTAAEVASRTGDMPAAKAKESVPAASHGAKPHENADAKPTARAPARDAVAPASKSTVAVSGASPGERSVGKATGARAPPAAASEMTAAMEALRKLQLDYSSL